MVKNVPMSCCHGAIKQLQLFTISHKCKRKVLVDFTVHSSVARSGSTRVWFCRTTRLWCVGKDVACSAVSSTKLIAELIHDVVKWKHSRRHR